MLQALAVRYRVRLLPGQFWPDPLPSWRSHNALDSGVWQASTVFRVMFDSVGRPSASVPRPRLRQAFNAQVMTRAKGRSGNCRD